MPKPIRVIELNPPSPPEVTPHFTSRVKFAPSGRTVSTYETHNAPRRVQVLSGDMLITENRRPEHKVGSVFDLPAPQARSDYEQGADGATLRILNICNYTHTVRTPPNVINGNRNTITLTGPGACVELYAHGGIWLAIGGSAGAKIT